MSIQFLGMIGHRLSSETIAPVGPIFDRDYIVRFAQTHEAAGFDRLLVGHWSDQPDGFLVTATARTVDAENSVPAGPSPRFCITDPCRAQIRHP